MEVHEQDQKSSRKGITLSTDCQLASPRRSAGGAVCSNKNAIGTASQARTLRSYRSTLCLHTHTRTHTPGSGIVYVC